MSGEPTADAQLQKLKAARAEIEDVLKRHDVAGFVSLHAPGWNEVFWNIWPSYSNLIGDFPAIRVHSKAADYGGDTAKQLDDQASTAQMAHVLAHSLQSCGNQFAALSQVLARMLRAEHQDGAFVPEPSRHNTGLH